MSAPVRTSACVDCATPIIGDRLRCPACHEDHAATIAQAPMTAPAASRESFWQILLSCVVITVILALIVCTLVLATRGCVSATHGTGRPQ